MSTDALPSVCLVLTSVVGMAAIHERIEVPFVSQYRYYYYGYYFCGWCHPLGAVTRATEGPVVADKNCEKVHYMAPNIFCCGLLLVLRLSQGHKEYLTNYQITNPRPFISTKGY